jgi:hypothetical protein
MRSIRDRADLSYGQPKGISWPRQRSSKNASKNLSCPGVVMFVIVTKRLDPDVHGEQVCDLLSAAYEAVGGSVVDADA